MLTASEKGHEMSRIKGRPALVKRLRGLLIAVHRFGRVRARTSDDIQWTAALLDALYGALSKAEDTGRNTDVVGGEQYEKHQHQQSDAQHRPEQRRQTIGARTPADDWQHSPQHEM